MGCSDQGYDHLTIYVAACPRVGLFRFRCEASGYALKRRLRLHTKETSHRDDKGVEAVALQKKNSRYFFFFYFSAVWRHFYSDLFW